MSIKPTRSGSSSSSSPSPYLTSSSAKTPSRQASTDSSCEELRPSEISSPLHSPFSSRRNSEMGGNITLSALQVLEDGIFGEMDAMGAHPSSSTSMLEGGGLRTSRRGVVRENDMVLVDTDSLLIDDGDMGSPRLSHRLSPRRQSSISSSSDSRENTDYDSSAVCEDDLLVMSYQSTSSVVNGGEFASPPSRTSSSLKHRSSLDHYHNNNNNNNNSNSNSNHYNNRSNQNSVDASDSVFYVRNLDSGEIFHFEEVESQDTIITADALFGRRK